jgi:hypothetical protein
MFQTCARIGYVRASSNSWISTPNANWTHVYMNLFNRNSPYYHLLKYLLFFLKHPVYICFFLVYRGAQSFHKSWRHLKILHARRVTKQVPYWGITKIRRHRTNICTHSDMASGICAPLYVLCICSMCVPLPHKNSSRTLFSCHKIESRRKYSHGRQLVILCSADLESPLR